VGRNARRRAEPTEARTLDSITGDDFGGLPGIALPAGTLNVVYDVNGIAHGACRYVVAGVYTVTIPGALDPPPFSSEIGPWSAALVGAPGG